jgi:hypothetical protein
MFNANLAHQMHGVTTESELRNKICGTMSALEREEVEKIIEHLSRFDSPTYAEIGVYFGGTFATILEHLKNNHDSYFAYGFDLFEDLETEVFGDKQTHELRNKWNTLNVAGVGELNTLLTSMGYTNFSLVKGSSELTVPTIDDSIDVCLIDGNHTYNQVKLDFESVYRKCKVGSVIVFDNSSNDIEPDPRYVAVDGGPWKFCQELKKNTSVKFMGMVNRCSFFSVQKSEG